MAGMYDFQAMSGDFQVIGLVWKAPGTRISIKMIKPKDSNCKIRRRYSRERASPSLGGDSIQYSIRSLLRDEKTLVVCGVKRANLKVIMLQVSALTVQS